MFCRCRHLLLPVALFLPHPAFAQTPSADEWHVSLSGYVQPQYVLQSNDDGTRDRVLFRRMLLSVEAALPASWTAEFQVDAGPVASSHEGRLLVKDANLRYTSWEDRGIVLTIGNQKIPFSRSLLTSSSRRGLVERPIAGDRSLGSPGRAPAVLADGWHRERTIHWSAALGLSRQSPDPDEVRVDGMAEARHGWNNGPLAAARIEVHPLGEAPRTQSDLARGPLRVTAALGAYLWQNSDASVRHPNGFVDADRVSGIEVSGALRGGGLSIDAEYEHVVSDAIEPGVDAGLYIDGRAVLDKLSIETGCMLLPRRLEALVGLDLIDSRAFETTWRRVSSGMNWYMNGHRLKLSLMHRESFDDRGARHERSRATYLQTQFSF